MNAAVGAPTVNVYSASTAGHRGEYLQLFERILDSKQVSLNIRSVLDSSALFMIMIEEGFIRYFMVAMIRSFLGLKTAGLLLRPQPALDGKSVRLRMKRCLLKVLKRRRAVSTLTILPFELRPDFAEIADGWIYDPQLWDLSILNSESQLEDKDRMIPHEACSSRQVCCALGRQDRFKGFDLFCEIYTSNEDIREKFCFVFGGRVAEDLESHLRSFIDFGGYGENRYISAGELAAYYHNADLIWCCYDRDYDQASGILGRAVQLGIPAVVRDGSLIHRLCVSEKIAHIALSGNTSARLLLDPPRKTPLPLAAAESDRRAAISIRSLRMALGLEC